MYSLEKGFPQSPGMMLSLQCGTWRFLKVDLGVLALGWCCRRGFNPTKCSCRGTNMASGQRRLSSAPQGNLLGNEFYFCRRAYKAKGRKKFRPHLAAEPIPARTSVPAVLVALSVVHPHPVLMGAKMLVQS